jgi:hypothetical protein
MPDTQLNNQRVFSPATLSISTISSECFFLPCFCYNPLSCWLSPAAGDVVEWRWVRGDTNSHSVTSQGPSLPAYIASSPQRAGSTACVNASSLAAASNATWRFPEAQAVAYWPAYDPNVPSWCVWLVVVVVVVVVLLLLLSFSSSSSSSLLLVQVAADCVECAGR